MTEASESHSSRRARSAAISAAIARTGNDVTLIDPWPEHIETIRAQGLAAVRHDAGGETTRSRGDDHAHHRGAAALQGAADRYRDRFEQILRHRMGTLLIRPYLSAHGYRRFGAELDQRGDDRPRGRLGPHGRVHRRDISRSISTSRVASAARGRRRDHTVILRRRGARPRDAARRGTPHVRADRRRHDNDEPVGRALVETVRERHAQRRQRRDRHGRQ